MMKALKGHYDLEVLKRDIQLARRPERKKIHGESQ